LTSDPLRCQMCGTVIGVYEPLTVRADGTVRTSSIASEPELSPLIGGHYHLDCYDLQREDYTLVGLPEMGTRPRLVEIDGGRAERRHRTNLRNDRRSGN
jgi:hypothetical protein